MQKWEAVRIYCTQIPRPHDKYCISVIPDRNGFFFINSNPPAFRKAREFAVAIARHELGCLVRDSFVDTTSVEFLLTQEVDAAEQDADRNYGTIAPFLRDRIIAAVQTHGALTQDVVDAILS